MTYYYGLCIKESQFIVLNSEFRGAKFGFSEFTISYGFRVLNIRILEVRKIRFFSHNQASSGYEIYLIFC